MTITTVPIKRALLSVSDKTNILELAKCLNDLGVDIISTGGTSNVLADAHIPHKQIEEITGFADLFEGRVKTLHPHIHAGILGKRDKHAQAARQHHIPWIDLVVVNFYPFEKAVLENKNLNWEQAVEYIDIGGPTLVRAAAKNFAWVAVITDINDYEKIIIQLKQSSGLDLETRKNLAEKAFALTSHYDTMIHQYFLTKDTESHYSPYLNLKLKKIADLRYGENPHQKASAYAYHQYEKNGILAAKQHQGKPLSYNNILDAEAALTCAYEFNQPACGIVKHANPCGVAIADSIEHAYEKAYQSDAQSAFGGVIALNRPCTQKMAEKITGIFMEVIIAPGFSEDALSILKTKPNLRVLEMSTQQNQNWEMKFIAGGVLLQEKDKHRLLTKDLNIVTRLAPQSEDSDALLFAWQVVKHVKSNAIVIAKNKTTVGIGAGQVSRVDAVDIAIRKAGMQAYGSVLASDAFFPFRDSIDRLVTSGVKAIIQPGGSVRDEEVIAACNEHKIAMVFTGKRCFKH